MNYFGEGDSDHVFTTCHPGQHIVGRKEFRKGSLTIHCDEHTDDDGNERRMKKCRDDETGMKKCRRRNDDEKWR